MGQGGPVAVKDAADHLQHAIGCNISHETEPALVHPDQRHTRHRKVARRIKHAAVATQNHGEVGASTNFGVVCDGKAFQPAGLSRVLIQEHLAAAILQEAAKGHEGLLALARVVAPEKGQSLESGHGDH